MNYNLNFPIENYAALYLAIIKGIDTENALRKIMPDTRTFRLPKERERLLQEAKALVAQGHSVRRAAAIININRSTLVWWIKKES